MSPYIHISIITHILKQCNVRTASQSVKGAKHQKKWPTQIIYLRNNNNIVDFIHIQNRELPWVAYNKYMVDKIFFFLIITENKYCLKTICLSPSMIYLSSLRSDQECSKHSHLLLLIV